MTTKIVFLAPQSEKPLDASAADARTISLDQINLDAAAKRIANTLLLKYMTLKLIHRETDAILVAHLVDKQRIFVGRGDPEVKQNLEVDLIGYGGREKGVSRLHAAFRRIGNVLAVVDLNSTNGTYRNSARLSPGKLHFLLNGDEICFGNMLFQVHFGY